MANIDQVRSIYRPPLFSHTNFGHWKRLMQIYIMDQDYELGNIMENAQSKIIHNFRTKELEKTVDQYTIEEYQRVQQNCKPLNALYYPLDENNLTEILFMKQLQKWGTPW